MVIKLGRIDLTAVQIGHKKVKHIKYDCQMRGPQEYLLSRKLDNENSSLLHNLSCRSMRGVKGNLQTCYNQVSTKLFQPRRFPRAYFVLSTPGFTTER